MTMEKFEDTIFAAIGLMTIPAALWVLLTIPNEPIEETEDHYVECTCAGRPIGCEVAMFHETGSPSGPVAHCALWREEGEEQMACCAVGRSSWAK